MEETEEIQAEEVAWNVTVTAWLVEDPDEFHGGTFAVAVNAGADFASLDEAEQLKVLAPQLDELAAGVVAENAHPWVRVDAQALASWVTPATRLVWYVLEVERA